MKCSQAIKELEELDNIVFVSKSPDRHDAIILAIGCVKLRMQMTQGWASSMYQLLLGEDREEPKAHER